VEPAYTPPKKSKIGGSGKKVKKEKGKKERKERKKKRKKEKERIKRKKLKSEGFGRGCRLCASRWNVSRIK
jgi:hypothetical protein